MDVDTNTFIRAIEENAKNNERLAEAIGSLSHEVKEIHEKYRDFSKSMLIMKMEMGFSILLTAGILFKLMTF